MSAAQRSAATPSSIRAEAVAPSTVEERTTSDYSKRAVVNPPTAQRRIGTFPLGLAKSR